MSFLKITGAILIIASCGGIGAAKVFALRKYISITSVLRCAVKKMMTEICVRCSSLPEAAARTEDEFPNCFAGLGDLDKILRDKSFAEIWKEHFRSMELPKNAEKAICTLGEELSAGIKPETAFAVCLQQLQTTERKLKEILDSNGKVYIALGIAAGSLLLIVSV